MRYNADEMHVVFPTETECNAQRRCRRAKEGGAASEDGGRFPALAPTGSPANAATSESPSPMRTCSSHLYHPNHLHLTWWRHLSLPTMLDWHPLHTRRRQTSTVHSSLTLPFKFALLRTLYRPASEAESHTQPGCSPKTRQNFFQELI